MVKMKSKVLWFGLVILLITSSVYGLVFIGDFSQGAFQNTFYNGSVLKLNSGNLTGLYISPIFDAGNISNWTSVSWNSTEQGELPNYLQSNLMNGNILLYHLNELSGNITDYSNNSYNATSYGGVAYNQQGKLNGAIGFDGVNDYLVINQKASLKGQSKATISLWYKPNAKPSSGNPALYYESTATAGYTRFAIYHRSDAGYSGAMRDSDSGTVYLIYNSSTVSLGNWHHFVLTHDADTDIFAFYIDGNLQGTNNSAKGAFTSTNSADQICIGAYCTTASSYLNGSVDEVSVWNRSLSSSEVKDLYRRGIAKLNLSVKGCDDGNCTSSNWTLINGTSPQNISIYDKRYFQYKFYFETTNSTFSPEVYWLGVQYYPTGNQSYQNNQTNQTENPPDNNTTQIVGGSSGGTYKEDEQKQIVVSYSKEELTRQILSIIIGVLVFIGLIILLVYLIIKVVR